MRYSILTQQPQAIEWGFSLSECFLFAFLFEVPTWAENVDIEGETFYHCSRFKVLDELPILTDKPDTVYRLFKDLDSKGVIKYKKLGGRDYIKITKKGAIWNKNNSEKNPNTFKNSEKNPNKLGKKSENNSEKNPTDNIIIEDINTTIDKNTPPIGEAADFEDYEKQILENSVTAVLESLNLHAGRNLPVKGERAEANRKKIKALFKKKYTEAEMKDVIQCKCFEWGKDAKMAQYLHPSTLFLPSNFQKYLDLVTDLKNDPKKAELFKKKINGASKQPGELISQQSLTNITARILDDIANGRPL